MCAFNSQQIAIAAFHTFALHINNTIFPMMVVVVGNDGDDANYHLSKNESKR